MGGRDDENKGKRDGGERRTEGEREKGVKKERKGERMVGEVEGRGWRKIGREG